MNKKKLSETHPHLMAQWHPTKNGDLTPSNVTAGSNKKVWWKCNKEHEWLAVICSRTIIGRGCPYCCNQKACVDNCLKTLRPDIACEWHPTKNGNVKPIDVVAKSGKKYWFLWKAGENLHIS